MRGVLCTAIGIAIGKATGNATGMVPVLATAIGIATAPPLTEEAVGHSVAWQAAQRS